MTKRHPGKVNKAASASGCPAFRCPHALPHRSAACLRTPAAAADGLDLAVDRATVGSMACAAGPGRLRRVSGFSITSIANGRSRFHGSWMVATATP